MNIYEKKKTKKSVETYKIYTSKVLKRVYPNIDIFSKSMDIINNLINGILRSLLRNILD
ncbi:Histone H2B [Capsicum annuum]|uniref:Histone H2B n=1 Tax=Capsicum annuum TaxID=4072 RepID=A0A2G3A6L7_CAPAN|nr:Histone H2B [Capsicum annuum]